MASGSITATMMAGQSSRMGKMEFSPRLAAFFEALEAMDAIATAIEDSGSERPRVTASEAMDTARRARLTIKSLPMPIAGDAGGAV